MPQAMPIYQPTEENFERAAAIIRSGGIVAFPTETVYGLGADCFNPRAAAKIFEVKNRPFFDPLIAHVNGIGQAAELCRKFSGTAERLAEKFWPGPLTLVLEKKKAVPDIVTAGLATVAVRMPAHPAALALIEKAGVPIAAPSANPFGYLSPTSASHVLEQLGSKVDMIIDGGICSVGVESTIIKIEDERLFLLRPGGIAAGDIESAAGKILGRAGSGAVEAPGQLRSHYAPGKNVILVRSPEDMDIGDDRAAFLFFKKPRGGVAKERAEILSEGGDLAEAAANLFSCLYRLDKMDIDVIYAESVPETGLGCAIMDRLRKASYRT